MTEINEKYVYEETTITDVKEKPIVRTFEGSRTGLKMRTSAIRKHVRVITKRTGIIKRTYPHLFRHSLGMNMLLKGCDIYSVKEQLRHTFLSTTEIYIASNPQIMKNNYQVFVPNYYWGVV